jgi:DNA repair exonuclease SbcCD ATPase subunit
MLSRVNAVNFQSWKLLEFKITSGVTMIGGYNEDDQTPEGSGKSAILNAICWNLFGKLPKEAKVDDVIKDGEDYCDVETIYSNGDSIWRSRGPNELHLKLASGKIVKGKDAKETQQLIEEYIGLNFETFCQSTYFAQNYDKKFLPSNQEDKGKILSSIQNIQVFDKARKEVMELHKMELDKQTGLKNKINIGLNSLASLESQKKLIENFIQEKLQKHQTQLQVLQHRKTQAEYGMNEINIKVQELETLIQGFDIAAILKDEADITAVRPEYVQQLLQIQHDKSQINTVIQGIRSKEKEGQDLTQKYQMLQTRIDTNLLASNQSYIRNQVRKKSLQDFDKNQTNVRLQTKRRQLVDFMKNPTKNCPSCGTELKKVDLTHTQKEIGEIDVEIQQLVDIVNQDIDVLDREVLQIQADIDNQNTKTVEEMNEIIVKLNEISAYLDANPIPSVESLAAKEAEAKSIVSQIDATIISLQTQKSEYSKFQSNLEVQKGNLEFHIAANRQVLNEISALGHPDVAADEAKIASIIQELNLTSQANSEVVALLQQSEVYGGRLETLKDGFKEIKSYVFNNALNELNFRTNQYLSDLFEMDAKIKFTNDDQKIESRITLNGRETSLGLLSGGQNRRFNLAVDLAIADIVASRKASKLNVLILDEYFKDLSEVSMEKCLDLLTKRKCPVILVEHNTLFKNIVENTFFARLKDGTTTESKAD